MFDCMGEGQVKCCFFFKKVQSFICFGIFVVCGYLLVMMFFGGDGDNKVLIGFGGMLVVVIGFVLKDIVSLLMSGIFIFIDQFFQVGDCVVFGDIYGEVKEIGLCLVCIVMFDDNEVFILNNKFFIEVVVFVNFGVFDMMVVIKFYIVVMEDFELVKCLVYEVCVISKYVFLYKFVVINVKDEVIVIIYVMIILVKVYVIDVCYEMVFIIDVIECVKCVFCEYQIYYFCLLYEFCKGNLWVVLFYWLCSLKFGEVDDIIQVGLFKMLLLCVMQMMVDNYWFVFMVIVQYGKFLIKEIVEIVNIDEGFCSMVFNYFEEMDIIEFDVQGCVLLCVFYFRQVFKYLIDLNYFYD